MLTEPSRPLAPSRLKKAGYYFAVASLLVLILGYYGWAVSPGKPLFGHARGDLDYYNLLIKGFRSGHLSLAVETPPGVLKLQDPYDPKQNAPFGMHDVSYYKGKFYLYFGVTPAAVLYGPFQLLTGHSLEDGQAVFIFCAVGFLAGAGLVMMIRRTYFTRAGLAVELAGILAMGFATMVPVLLRRQQIYEVAVSSAHACFLLSLLGLFLALHGRRQNLWLALSSLAFGLAVGARPTYLFGGLVLLFPVIARWSRADEFPAEARRRRARQVLAAVAPAGAVLAALLFYNYLRFENPFEFGQRLAFSGSDETQITHFSLSYVWFNCRAYLFASAQLSTYFPFVRVVWLPPGPPGHYGVEDPYGIFPNIPFVLLAALAPLACRGRPRLGVFAAAVAVAGLAVAAVIFTFQFATNRYMVDFLPGFVLLAVLGFWGLLARFQGVSRGWIGGLGGFVLGWSVLFNLFASLNHNELLRVENPVAFTRLLHAFDEPRHLKDQLTGRSYGPAEITVRFPTDKRGKVEPLLITGSEFLSDYLYVYYVSPTAVVIGFEHTGHGGPVSGPITVDYGKPHRLFVDLPSLYPPEGDPYYDDIPAGALEAFAGRLKVSLDGSPVFDSPQVVYPAFRFHPLIGRSTPGQQGLGRQFTGDIQQVRYLAQDWKALAKSTQSGPVVVSLAFPANNTGAHEPLLTSGNPGRGDVLVANFVDPTHVTLSLDHWGYGGPTSPPIAIKPGTHQTMEIRFGSFFPGSERPPDVDPARWSKASSELTVLLDHVRVFETKTAFYAASPATVSVGRNTIGASSSVAQFSGEIFNSYRGNFK